MADSEWCSPPRKKRTQSTGKQYTLFLGYGEKGKNLWDEHDDIRLLLRLETSAETTAWILEKVRPIVAEHVKATYTSTIMEDNNVGVVKGVCTGNSTKKGLV